MEFLSPLLGKLFPWGSAQGNRGTEGIWWVGGTVGILGTSQAVDFPLQRGTGNKKGEFIRKPFHASPVQQKSEMYWGKEEVSASVWMVD